MKKDERGEHGLCWSNGGLVEVPNCPICGTAKAPRRIFRRRDNDNVFPDTWTVCQCSSCLSMWLNPRPDDASLPLAYENYYTHYTDIESRFLDPNFLTRLINGYLNRRFGMRRYPAIDVGYHLLRLIEPIRLKLEYYGRHLPRLASGSSATLLDIGCGNGAFLDRTIEMGWTAVGCETDTDAWKHCHNRGLNVILGDAFHPELDSRTFDAITLGHVLEHVEDPWLLLKRVHTILAPQGVAWIALPNPQAIGRLFFGKSWGPLHPPYHLKIPSQQQLRILLEGVGFRKIVFARRGIQSRVQWMAYNRIADRENQFTHKLSLMFVRGFADSLSTISSRWSEESVVIAVKN